MRPEKSDIFGLAAEFASPEAILHAVEQVRAAGYREVEAYTPFPVPGVADALGFTSTRIPLLCLVGGILGACGGYFMMWYANVISYPWNIGGKPPNSWPAFIPITFEMMVLGAAIMTILGLLALNGLPMPYHPMFHWDRFELASQSRFFLCIEASDPLFDPQATRTVLEATHPASVTEVPW